MTESLFFWFVEVTLVVQEETDLVLQFAEMLRKIPETKVFGSFSVSLEDVTNLECKISTPRKYLIERILDQLNSIENLHPNFENIWIYTSKYGHILSPLMKRVHFFWFSKISHVNRIDF